MNQHPHSISVRFAHFREVFQQFLRDLRDGWRDPYVTTARLEVECADLEVELAEKRLRQQERQLKVRMRHARLLHSRLERERSARLHDIDQMRAAS